MSWKVIAAVIGGILVVAIPLFIEGRNAQNSINYIEESSAKQKASESWRYSNKVDEMRGITTRIATVRARQWLDMAPELFVLREKEKNALIAIRGSLENAAAPQMRCLGGSLSMKFDDGPVKQVRCSMGMSVGIDPRVFSDLKASKLTQIEIETSLGSKMQFKFRTADLEI